jgi:hypothetical protein
MSSIRKLPMAGRCKLQLEPNLSWTVKDIAHEVSDGVLVGNGGVSFQSSQTG